MARGEDYWIELITWTLAGLYVLSWVVAGFVVLVIINMGLLRDFGEEVREELKRSRAWRAVAGSPTPTPTPYQPEMTHGRMKMLERTE
jgi:hypothetical protein